jgi:hypothetical protein
MEQSKPWPNPTPSVTSMTNAKEELLRYAKNKIVCATIMYNPHWDDSAKTFTLKVGYTQEEYNQFLDSLDFEYDRGYGLQELFGTVWLEDGMWMERGEYDGSEWWEIHTRPEIPENLK